MSDPVTINLHRLARSHRFHRGFAKRGACIFFPAQACFPVSSVRSMFKRSLQEVVHERATEQMPFTGFAAAISEIAPRTSTSPWAWVTPSTRPKYVSLAPSAAVYQYPFFFRSRACLGMILP